MKIQWLGQAGYKLYDDKTCILIDPYLSNMVFFAEGFNRLIPPAILIQNVKADYIFFTHTHLDHLDSDMISQIEKKNTFFVGPSSGKDILKKCNVPEKNILCFNREDSLNCDNFHIKAVYAEHTIDSIGLLILYNNIRYYFTGDTLFTEKVGKNIQADIIFVCINGKLGNMNVKEAALLTEKVNAKLGIPNHYGMFAENTQDPFLYENLLKNTSCKPFLMEYNQSYNLELELSKL